MWVAGLTLLASGCIAYGATLIGIAGGNCGTWEFWVAAPAMLIAGVGLQVALRPSMENLDARARLAREAASLTEESRAILAHANHAQGKKFRRPNSSEQDGLFIEFNKQRVKLPPGTRELYMNAITLLVHSQAIIPLGHEANAWTLTRHGIDLAETCENNPGKYKASLVYPNSSPSQPASV